MGLITWMLRLFGWGASAPNDPVERIDDPDLDTHSQDRFAPPFDSVPEQPATVRTDTAVEAIGKRRIKRTKTRPLTRVRLTPSRQTASGRKRSIPKVPPCEVSGNLPYRFARFGSRTGSYLDLSQDGDVARLRQQGMPVFSTPEQLAAWLDLPMNKLAWLVHRFSGGRPTTVAKAHYHYTWLKKRSGGSRLIESPKQTLKQAQIKILREILDKLPAHSAAHGFVTGRSIVTNATPHVGQAVLVKLDLSNFYASVGFARVVAIFRTMGYSREAAIWLGLLTTTAVPGNMPFDGPSPYSLFPYLRRHLPQGAPTSPSLANLSAYRLDLRLSGLAKSFGARFTRYADDMAISGSAELVPGLRVLIPLAQQIIRNERFRFNRSKRRILRSHQRQTIAGVVVNEKTNVARGDYDRLKAILTNCVRLGPSTQNRSAVDDFAAHLRGRIAHVLQLNPQRGQKLLTIFQTIDWRR